MISALNQTNQMYKQYLHNNSIIIKNQHFKVGNEALKPAVTVDIQQYLNTLFKQRRDLYIDYKLLQDKILFGTNPAIHRKKFEEIHSTINDVQKQIDDVYDYYDLISEPKPDVNAHLKSQVDILYKSLEDESIIPQYIKQYKKLEMKEKAHEESKVPDHIVLKIPELTTAPVKPTKPEKLAAKQVKVEKPKVNSDVIKDKIKELIKQKFKSQNFEQCASQKRTQPYFMKREELIDVISNNPDLAKTMPSNYKSMSKENLCKILFP